MDCMPLASDAERAHVHTSVMRLTKIEQEALMPNFPNVQDFVVDLSTRTVAMREIPACTFSFYEYVDPADWALADTCWVTNPELLPGPVSQFAAAAKRAALIAGMTHHKPL